MSENPTLVLLNKDLWETERAREGADDLRRETFPEQDTSVDLS